jgi:SAM-dependent methyltransferase
MQSLNAKELERRDASRKYFPVLRRRASRVWDILSAWSWYQRQRLGPSSDFYVPPSRLPPMRLRTRVNGLRDLYSFLVTGRACADDIESAVRSVGRPLASFQSVLDFGCGCGRTISWLQSRAPNTSFTGCDVDAEAIAWCRTHLPEARFAVNAPEPPLDNEDAAFDLIYVISLFTHFDENAQEAWLDELFRVAKSGGLVLATVHGESVWADYEQELVEPLKTHGFAYFVSDPSGSPSFQTSYQSESYVRERFGKRFKILAYLPQGLNRHQDLVILEKR